MADDGDEGNDYGLNQGKSVGRFSFAEEAALGIYRLTETACSFIILPWVNNSLGRSQVGKARDFDSRMRWFESSRPSHFILGAISSVGRAPDF